MRIQMRDSGMKLKARFNGKTITRKVYTSDDPEYGGEYVRLGQFGLYQPDACVLISHFLDNPEIELIGIYEI